MLQMQQKLPAIRNMLISNLKFGFKDLVSYDF